MPLLDDKDPTGTPGEEPKPPQTPGSKNPEPDVPDESDDLGDLLKPVIA